MNTIVAVVLKLKAVVDAIRQGNSPLLVVIALVCLALAFVLVGPQESLKMLQWLLELFSEVGPEAGA